MVPVTRPTRWTKCKFLRFIDATCDRRRMPFSRRIPSCNRYVLYIGRGNGGCTLKNRPFTSSARARARAWTCNFKRKWDDDAQNVLRQPFTFCRERDTFSSAPPPKLSTRGGTTSRFISRTRQPNSKHARLA